MAYLAPIHGPTSVKNALKLQIVSEAEESLVLAKANRLELYRRTNEGLELIHSRNLYGRVTILEKIRPLNSKTDHLFIGTDRHMYFTISWDEESHQLRTETSYADQADKISRDSQNKDRCQIDPGLDYMALMLFEGIVTVMPIQPKSRRKNSGDSRIIGDPVPARIPEIFVRSFTFLPTRLKDREQHKLALLYEDNHERVCLSIRALDYISGMTGEPDSAELKDYSHHDGIELGASHLIPVPEPIYGLIILCEASICFYSEKQDEMLVQGLDHPIQFVAWASIDNQRWILSDDFGILYLLMITIENQEEVSGWRLDPIGKTSQASVLVYLDHGCLFVGSHQGDSQLIQIKEGGVEIIQTVPNIAPVLDFSIMDMGNRSGEGQTNEYSSGQARIVTGSGAFQDGSLRSVRSGVGLEEQGLLGEMDHATDLFAIRSCPESRSHDSLIISFVGETRIFLFHPDGEVSEQVQFKGLTTTESTVYASNHGEGRLLQVTNSSARLTDSENGISIAEWMPKKGQQITAASANSASLMLSIGGLEAMIFDLRQDMKVVQQKTFPDQGQISCIHLSPVCERISVAGFWKTATILIMDSTSLETITKVSLGGDAVSVPRSILLAHVLAEQAPTFFIAMADGEVFTYAFNLETLELSSKKVTILGTQQATFKILPRDDGLSNVFAICEHPSLIYDSEGRIVYSAITAERATSICPFDSELYPGSIAIATPEDVRIALVDTERTTHVQTLPIGQTVRRIAYSPRLKTFGIGTIERSLQGTQEIVQSHFKLADEVLFKTLDTYDLNEEELVESVARADIIEDSGELSERFVVGTGFLEDGQGESIRGRILIFAVTTERSLKLITELLVKGACRALNSIHGNIVAALSKSVVVYALRDSHLTKLASSRTSTAPVDLAIHAPTSQICVADLIKSLSILTYTPASASHPEDTLIETARHFQTAWATACAYVDTETWLEADAEGNLMVLKQNTAGVTADDKRRLEVVSEIRLGEMVNRLRPVQVEASPGTPVVPKAFMATVEGGVYLYAHIAPMWLDLLMRLQAALAPLIVSLGNVPFNVYRAFKNQVREADEPYRFVDGELVEGFLDLDLKTQEAVVDELGEMGKTRGGVEGIKALIEGLKRLH